MTETPTARPGTSRPDTVILPESPSAIARGSLRRFREGDGASHTRALAFQTMFVLISGFIGFVGLVSVLHLPAIRTTVTNLAKRIAPGPSSKLLAEAAKQGASSGGTAMVVGLLAALVAVMLAMTQAERSANRLMGTPEDRPTGARLARAFVLALSAGILLAIGGLVLGAGRSIGQGAGWEGTAGTIWNVVRWPLGMLLGALGTYLVFRFAPRERPSSRRAEVIGAVVAVVLWFAFTGLLAFYFSTSGSSSATYGPLLAIVALLLWSELASLAFHLGFAVTAELSARGRAVRATAGQRAA